MSKTLTIVRHAKSSWDDPVLADLQAGPGGDAQLARLAIRRQIEDNLRLLQRDRVRADDLDVDQPRPLRGCETMLDPPDLLVHQRQRPQRLGLEGQPEIDAVL